MGYGVGYEEGLIVCDGFLDDENSVGNSGQYSYVETLNSSYIKDVGNNNYEIDYDDAKSGLNLYFCYYHSFEKQADAIPEGHDFGNWGLRIDNSYDGVELFRDVLPKDGRFCSSNDGEYIYIFQYREIVIELKDEITSEIRVEVTLSDGNNDDICNCFIIIKPKKVTPDDPPGGTPDDPPSGSTNRVEEKKIFYPYEVGQCL